MHHAKAGAYQGLGEGDVPRARGGGVPRAREGDVPAMGGGRG